MILNKYTLKSGKVLKNVEPDVLIESHAESQADVDIAIHLAYQIEKRADINRIRNNRINAGIEFPEGSGNFYDSDDTAKANITGAVVMYSAVNTENPEHGEAFVQPWIKADGKTKNLTGPELVQLGLMLGQHVGLHRVQAAAYKEQLEEAIDTTAVDAVVTAYASL